MQTNSKVKWLWVAIILLLVLNLTTIGTIIYHSWQESDAAESIIVEPDSQPLNGKYFRQELGFDSNQVEVFRIANRKFRQEANEIIRSINMQKELLFSELQQAQPNTETVGIISDRIGQLHAQLKKVTADFYIELNKCCTPEQKEKLKTIFTPLFRESPHTGSSRGHGHGRGRGGNYDCNT